MPAAGDGNQPRTKQLTAFLPRCSFGTCAYGRTRHMHQTHLSALCLVVALAATTAARPEPQQKGKTPKLKAGDVCSLAMPGVGPAILVDRRSELSAFDEMVDAVKRKDNEKLQRMSKAGVIFAVAKDTPAEVISAHGEYYLVRVTDGDSKGRSGRVPAAWASPFDPLAGRLRPGTEVLLDVGSIDHVPLADTRSGRQAFNTLNDVLVRGDSERLVQLTKTGEVFVVGKNTRAKVLVTHPDCYEVKILAGPSEGRNGFVKSAWVMAQPPEDAKPVPDTMAEAKKQKAAAAEAKKRSEDAASAKLTLAKALLADGKADKAKPRLEQIVRDFPATKAAAEAKRILEGLK